MSAISGCEKSETLHYDQYEQPSKSRGKCRGKAQPGGDSTHAVSKMRMRELGFAVRLPFHDDFQRFTL